MADPILMVDVATVADGDGEDGVGYGLFSNYRKRHDTTFADGKTI